MAMGEVSSSGAVAATGTLRGALVSSDRASSRVACVRCEEFSEEKVANVTGAVLCAVVALGYGKWY